MIELELKREKRTVTYTLGHLYINGRYFCDTIEDAVRILNEYEDKIYGETAIPYGRYKVVLTHSSHFKCIMPELLNVDFFKGIRIHWGNTAEDSKGCIIVGKNVDKNKGFVGESKKTYAKLMEILQSTNEEIVITVS